MCPPLKCVAITGSKSPKSAISINGKPYDANCIGGKTEKLFHNSSLPSVESHSTMLIHIHNYRTIFYQFYVDVLRVHNEI